MENEVHDMSRVDSFMAARRRAMFFHSVWKPMLAGAVGAAIISATIIGSMWVASPKLHFNEIEVPRIVQKDVTVDHVVPKDVTVPNIVPKDVEVPHVILKDVAVPVPVPPTSPSASGAKEDPYAAHTPEEQKFTAQPEYQSAEYRGCIIKSTDGRALSFEDGKGFWPSKLNANGQPVSNPAMANDSDAYIGDLGMCTQKPEDHMWECVAFHNGQTVPVMQKPVTAQADAKPLAPTKAGKRHMRDNPTASTAGNGGRGHRGTGLGGML
jgi:hypothetical protein